MRMGQYIDNETPLSKISAVIPSWNDNLYENRWCGWGKWTWGENSWAILYACCINWRCGWIISPSAGCSKSECIIMPNIEHIHASCPTHQSWMAVDDIIACAVWTMFNDAYLIDVTCTSHVQIIDVVIAIHNHTILIYKYIFAGAFFIHFTYRSFFQLIHDWKIHFINSWSYHEQAQIYSLIYISYISHIIFILQLIFCLMQQVIKTSMISSNLIYIVSNNYNELLRIWTNYLNFF